MIENILLTTDDMKIVFCKVFVFLEGGATHGCAQDLLWL